MWDKKGEIAKRHLISTCDHLPLPLFLKDFIWERAQASTSRWQRGRGRGRNKLPDDGLDPRTLGPPPEPKADAYSTEPPRHPTSIASFYPFTNLTISEHIFHHALPRWPTISLFSSVTSAPHLVFNPSARRVKWTLWVTTNPLRESL